MAKFKFKLSFQEPTYFVNEEKQIVTCVVKYTLNASDWNITRALSLIDNHRDPIFGNVMTSYSVAKLDPTDTFDVDKGKRVARAKAESKAYDKVSQKMVKMFCEFMDDTVDEMNTFCEKANGVVEHNSRYLEGF